MKNAIALVLSLPVLLSSIAVSLAGRPEFDRYLAVRESLYGVHPRFHERWLRTHGYDVADFMPRRYPPPESSVLQLRGKWGRGRSVEVTGQDSLVFLTLGSEIAILNFADPDEPRLLTELQLDFCPTQTYVRDSLLVTGGWAWIETWDVSDPALPVFRSRIQHPVGDFCVRDSLLFFVSGDSFRVFSIADPAVPYQLGACRDSGWATTVAGNTVVLVLHDGFGFMDVSNPRAPRRVGFYGGNSIAARARGTICCISNNEGGVPQTASFEVLDISNSAAPVRLSKLSASGGYDIELVDTLAFISGWQHPYGEFCIIDIADSTQPGKLGTYTTPGDNWGGWASLTLGRAFVADWRKGLRVLDITNPASPTLDTIMLVADQTEDVFLEGNLAYVANYGAGLRILDVSDPSRPTELGGMDSIVSTCWSVVARDSFAFVGWRPNPYFRTVNVADPARPEFAATCATFDIPMDMVLRDTLAYCAMPYRFQIVNVARPRQPVLVGSCVTQDGVSFGLAVQDSFAYVISGWLQIINVAQPSSPYIVSSTSGGATGIAVRDTFAYIPNVYDSVRVYSVANPAAPRRLSVAPCGVWPRDVALGESTLYVGTSDGWGVDVFDITNPGQPVRIGRASAPHDIRRLHYAGGRLYAAMWEAGVAVYETTTTGLVESSAPHRVAGPLLEVRPTLTRGSLAVRPMGNVVSPIAVSIWDAAGRAAVPAQDITTQGPLSLDLTLLPRGVYWLKAETGSRNYVVKVVKQ